MPAAHAFAADVVELRLQRDYLDFSTPTDPFSPLYSYHESMAMTDIPFWTMKSNNNNLYNAHA